ncbi:MAG TPA: xanthine dehydrogenase family protein molybdopterin-binding subunit [Conexivisphaerales archaeon]|nr:xanthine dehydrogenase family protein molybdopterin-binding subunit [Conexivisphaerales archaeon]
MSSNYSVVGKPSTDNFAMPRVLGRWKFPADQKLDGLLYTSILSSPYPHAKITSIDASAALALPGVMAVATYKDIPYFSQELFFVGQEVAAIAATDPDIAEQATDLIKVTYQVLPYVINPDDALKNQVLTGVTPGTNIVGGQPSVITVGNTANGFAASDTIMEEDIGWSAVYQHSPLISRTALAVWSFDDTPQVTVWTVSQNPYSQQGILAGYLGIPQKDVHIITHGTSGGFGDLHTAEWCCVAAVLSKMTGRPVLNQLSKKDNYLQAIRQYRNKAHLKIGAKKDGTIMAVEGTVYLDSGGNAGFGVGDTLSPMQITYRCPNLKLTGYAINTNTPGTGAWRCVGEPGGTWLFEQVIDDLAYKLNMDPVQFRLKNLMTASEKDPATGLPYTSLAAVDCLQKASASIGWSSKWHAPGTKQLSDGRYHGIGVASFICNKGPVAVYGATGPVVLTTPDGGFHLLMCQSNINTTAREMTMIAAETLGVPLDAVDIGVVGDSHGSNNCGMQGGSSRTGHSGNGVIAACNDVKQQVFALAATALSTTPDKLSVANGKIFLTADPTKSTTYAAVLASAPPINGRGYNVMDYTKTTRTGSTTCVEVAVDKETGEVEITNIVVADDIGQVIYPLGALGQMRSGMVHGIGFTTMWHQTVDANAGVMMNPDLRGHRYPTMSDLPIPSITTALYAETHDSLGPYGAKGLGEPPVGVVGPAIANAVYNAIGVRMPEQGVAVVNVLKALGLG